MYNVYIGVCWSRGWRTYRVVRNFSQFLGKNLRQAVFCSNVLSIVSGTNPKKFESVSDGGKKLDQIFSRRLTHPKDRT